LIQLQKEQPKLSFGFNSENFDRSLLQPSSFVLTLYILIH